MNSVRRSFLLHLLDNNAGVVLQMISGIILARVLTPKEVGVYAVAAVVIAMAGQLRDFGLSEYLIQERDLDAQKIRAAFMVNIGTSWTMALVIAGASQWIGQFYDEPGITQVLQLQSVNFLIVPFGAVTMAYFRRELNFRPIFIANQAAYVTTFVVGVGCALAGLSYMSMAWAAIAGLLVTVLVAMYFRPPELPRWPSLKGTAHVLHFSKHAMSIYFIGQIGKGAPEAVIGRVLDVTTTAFYSRANGLMEIFNRVVLRTALNICLPYFSRESRSGNGAGKAYLGATVLLTGAGWPFLALLGLLAYSVIRLLYGDQWVPAVPLAAILCLVGIADLPYWLTGEAMIAVGRVDQSSRLQLFLQLLRIAGLVIGVSFGLEGACWGLLASTLIGGFVSQRYLRRIIDLHFVDLLRACTPSLLVTITVVGPVWTLVHLWGQNQANYLGVLGTAGLMSLALWLVALRTFRHPLWQEIMLVASRIRQGREAGRPG